MYTFVSFLLVCPDAPNAMGMPAKFYFYVAIKSFIIFLAWILSFVAIKKLPLSMYGVLDLSRVLFATLLGVTVLGEKLSAIHVVGLVFVCAGLALLKFKPVYEKRDIASSGNPGSAVEKEIIKNPGSPMEKEKKYTAYIIIVALISCMLNSLSGLMDKILMKDITSSQLQFWYMLFLCLFYIIYAAIGRANISVKRALKNKWIWILAVMFVVADRALFVANAMPESKVTIMTLIKQSGTIVSILAGKLIFKEKNITHKLICAGVIIVGIILGVM